MSFFENAVLGFCHWDGLALAFIAVMTGWHFLVQHKLKKEIKGLEDQLD